MVSCWEFTSFNFTVANSYGNESRYCHLIKFTASLWTGLSCLLNLDRYKYCCFSASFLFSPSSLLLSIILYIFIFNSTQPNQQARTTTTTTKCTSSSLSSSPSSLPLPAPQPSPTPTAPWRLSRVKAAQTAVARPALVLMTVWAPVLSATPRATFVFSEFSF